MQENGRDIARGAVGCKGGSSLVETVDASTRTSTRAVKGSSRVCLRIGMVVDNWSA